MTDQTSSTERPPDSPRPKPRGGPPGTRWEISDLTAQPYTVGSSLRPHVCTGFGTGPCRGTAGLELRLGDSAEVLRLCADCADRALHPPPPIGVAVLPRQPTAQDVERLPTPAPDPESQLARGLAYATVLLAVLVAVASALVWVTPHQPAVTAVLAVAALAGCWRVRHPGRGR